MQTSVRGDTRGPEPFVSVQRNCFGPNVCRSDSIFLSRSLSSRSADCFGCVHPSTSLSVYFWFKSAVADCIMKPAHTHRHSVQGNGISSLPKVNSQALCFFSEAWIKIIRNLLSIASFLWTVFSEC